MKYKLFIFVLCMALPMFSQGQKLVSGKVTDSLGVALPQANVIVKSGRKILKYTLTDSLGFFEIKVPVFPEYDIKVTYFSYKPAIKHIIANKPITGLKFVLLHDQTALKEVVINADIPDFVQKKDTIIYNLNALTDGSEMKLKDLVQKLPGMRIDKNGKITQNGKPIDKILINNKEFFNRQQQIATENIDADMVSGISFYQNYKTEFDAKNDSGIRALNVNIKDKYIGKLKGNILSGMSADMCYKAHLNTFKFTKNANLALITDVNNWGYNALSVNDYIDFTGGVEAYIKGNVHAGVVDIDEENIPTFLLKGDDVAKRQTKFAGVNVVLQKKHRYRFTGFYLLNYMQQVESYKQTRRFINGQTNTNANGLNGDYFIINAYSKFIRRLSSKDVVTMLFTGTWQNDKGDYFNIASQNRFDNHFSQQHKSFGTSSRYNRTINENLIFDAELIYNFQNRKKIYRMTANYPFLSYFNLNLYNNNYTYNTSKTDYALTGNLTLFKPYYFINFSLGSKYQRSYLNSDLSHSVLQNNMGFNLFDGFAGAKMKYDQLSWHMVLSAHWHYNQIRYANWQSTYRYIAPFVSLTYLFSLSHSLNLTYNYDRKRLSINKFNLHYVFDDYQSLSETGLHRDDLYLPQHQISLGYQNYIKKHKFYYNLNINFNLVDKNVQDKLIYFEPQFYYYQKVLTPSSQRLMLDFNLNKSLIKHFYMSLSSDYTFDKQKIYFNNTIQNFDSQTLKNDISIYSTYKKSLINASLGFESKIFYSIYKSFNIDRQYISTTFYTKLNGKLKKSFKWSVYAGYESFNFLGNEHILKLNPAFYYQYSSSFQISLVGNNILNINHPVYAKRTQTDNFELFEKVAYLPGYVAFQLQYDF